MTDTTPFTVLPAIDVKSGKSVRLAGSDISNSSNEADPMEVAHEFQRMGARWIHLVDLDLAYGTGNNTKLIKEIIKNVDMKVQLSGGIKDEESYQLSQESGCERINMSCAAIENFTWLSAVLSRSEIDISIALDVDGDQIRPRGSDSVVGEIWSTLHRLDEIGCQRYSVTDVNRDGNLKGPNFDLLKAITSRTKMPITASGGVASVSDLTTLQNIPGVDGAIVGKALYTGAMKLSDALAACR